MHCLLSAPTPEVAILIVDSSCHGKAHNGLLALAVSNLRPLQGKKNVLFQVLV